MHFTQPEIEGQIAAELPYGMPENIARGCGLYPSNVHAWLNQNDERKSPWFTVLLVQAYLDIEHPETGERVWQKVNEIRNASMPVKESAEDIHGALLRKVGSSGALIKQIVKTLEDGQIDSEERFILLSMLKEVQAETSAAIDRLEKLDVGNVRKIA
jgi:hypothetical protein